MSEIDWFDDDDERGLESTAMTNRQWLMWKMIDMSDDEFTKMIDSPCELCRKMILNDSQCPAEACKEMINKWLKQEHEDENHTE